MFKKIMSILISVFMILTFMPTRSKASNGYPGQLYVGDQQVTNENTSGTGWSYDETTGTLTLSGANITSAHSSASIYCSDPNFNLIIKLIGNNVLGDGSTNYGILSSSCPSLIITGSGSLNINSTNTGIANSETNGGIISINGNAKVSINGSSRGIYSHSTLAIENSTVNISCSSSSSEVYAIHGGSNINITNSSVNVQGAPYAMRAESNINLSGSSYVHTKGDIDPMYAAGHITLNDELEVLLPENGNVSSGGHNIVDSQSHYVTEAIIGEKHPTITATANPTAGGTITGAGTYDSNTEVNLNATPNEHYNFVNWTENGTEVSSDSTYQFNITRSREFLANFEKQKHTVKFVNYDGTELQSSELDYGTTPVYEGENPSKPADAQYTYTFIGWTPEISEVTGDITYTATYSNTVNKYTVKFVDEDGTELQSSEFDYGTTPVYEGENPSKPADAQYTYTFIGWTPEISEVTGNITYTATYSNTVNKYTIKFVDEDGTELQSSEFDYGAIPAYEGETPSKPADSDYTYTFVGWDPQIAEVTQDATYTAVYEAEANTDPSESEGDNDDIIPLDGDDEEIPSEYEEELPRYKENSENMNSPITGDEANFPLWLVLASVSLIWLTLIFVFSKKRSQILDTVDNTIL